MNPGANNYDPSLFVANPTETGQQIWRRIAQPSESDGKPTLLRDPPVVRPIWRETRGKAPDPVARRNLAGSGGAPGTGRALFVSGRSARLLSDAESGQLMRIQVRRR